MLDYLYVVSVEDNQELSSCRIQLWCKLRLKWLSRAAGDWKRKVPRNTDC